MSDNRIVADAADKVVTTPTSGAGVVDTVYQTGAAIADGKWAEGLVDYTLAVAEFKSTMKNPLMALSSAGVGWIIEHVSFLTEPLDLVAGDQQQLATMSLTWKGIADEMDQAGADLTRLAETDSAGWQGDAVTRYLGYCETRATHYSAIAAGARGMSALLELSRIILGAVRGLIRGMISDCVVKIMMVILRYVPPATAAAIPEVTYEAATCMTQINGVLGQFVAACKNANHLLATMTSAIKNLVTELVKTTAKGVDATYR